MISFWALKYLQRIVGNFLNSMNLQELNSLIRELTIRAGESEWVEFKCSYVDPSEIGQYISAIANAAALHHQEKGYLIWGIENETQRIVGTAFKPRSTKRGNEELESWLGQLLFPRVDFRIHEFEYETKPMVLFEVPAALHTPVRFQGMEYIRVGSYKKKLHDYPEKERALWAIFQPQSFEQGIAAAGVKSDDVLALIDYPTMFDLLRQRLPENRSGILERLVKENVIMAKADDCYDITNLGAILFAKQLDRFGELARKAMRVVLYKDANRIETLKEQTANWGYAVGFERLMAYINDRLPQNEQIGQALRREVRMYPEIAIRELVANALIHQEFSMTGTGPMVEIFSDRIEITNPGTPLIDTLRFIDEPPRSRNEKLAAMMRRLNICEERGSGIDKVIFQIELYQLPAPDFQVTPNHTKALLFAPKKLTDMSAADRIRACYQHACLSLVTNKFMTNTSLRERFGIKEKNAAVASRIIAETVKAGLVKLIDPTNKSRKHAKYVPFWF